MKVFFTLIRIYVIHIATPVVDRIRQCIKGTHLRFITTLPISPCIWKAYISISTVLILISFLRHGVPIIKRVIANFIILFFYVKGAGLLFRSHIQNPYFSKHNSVPHNDIFIFVDKIKIRKNLFPNYCFVNLLIFFSHHKIITYVELYQRLIGEIRTSLNHTYR